MTEKPADQRPELPDFWDRRFAGGTTPWAAHGVPPTLRQFAAAVAGAPSVLVPGCGHAWEAAWLAQLGWQVTALDFSATAIETARAVLGDWPGRLLHADFFDFTADTPFDLIYERAFLCALPRKCWADYGRRMHQLLAPEGRLVGFYFFSDEPKGPPFGISSDALEALLSPYFMREADEAVPAADSIPVFAGRERWQVWRRRG